MIRVDIFQFEDLWNVIILGDLSPSGKLKDDRKHLELRRWCHCLWAPCKLQPQQTQTIGGLKQRNDEKFIKAAELDSIATSPIRDHLEQRQISWAQKVPLSKSRVEICRDHRDRRSCKILPACKFWQKTTRFLHNLSRHMQFFHLFCRFTSI